MLADLSELSKQATTGDGRGGHRPGAGRPKGATKKATQEKAEAKAAMAAELEIRNVEEILEDGPPPPLDGDSGALSFTLLSDPGVFYATAKARKEMAHAAKAELEFRIKDGQYLPREAIRSALAEAYQAVAQSLRSIPDNLERKLGLSPELAEVVSTAIDEAMGELAYAMELIHTENNESNNAD